MSPVFAGGGETSNELLMMFFILMVLFRVLCLKFIFARQFFAKSLIIAVLFYRFECISPVDFFCISMFYQIG